MKDKNPFQDAHTYCTYYYHTYALIISQLMGDVKAAKSQASGTETNKK